MKPARSLGDNGKAVLSTFKKFSPKKAPGIEQESSLRFDAFDGTEWKYVGAGRLLFIHCTMHITIFNCNVFTTMLILKLRKLHLVPFAN